MVHWSIIFKSMYLATVIQNKTPGETIQYKKKKKKE